MGNIVIGGFGGSIGLNPDELQPFLDQLALFRKQVSDLLALASCKLSDADALNVISNLSSTLTDLEVVVNDKALKQSEIVALINALDNKLNSL